jgi:hypothetical protein
VGVLARLSLIFHLVSSWVMTSFILLSHLLFSFQMIVLFTALFSSLGSSIFIVFYYSFNGHFIEDV